MLNPTIAVRTTARSLVRNCFGLRPLGRAAVHEAIEKALRRGWLPTYVPGPLELERSVVLLGREHPYAAIARCLAPDGRGVAQVGLIESRTHLPIANTMTGMMLARIGIAIVNVAGNNVVVRGTSPGFAMLVNLSRHDLLHLHPCARIVECATGVQLRPIHIDDDLRLRVALMFDEFEVDVPGLINREAESDVVSRWRFQPDKTPPPPPISQEPFPPTYPPAAPINPEEPPF